MNSAEPDVSVDPWIECMARGDFAGAWAVSDGLLRQRAGAPCWHWPRHLQYIWNGEPLAGKRVLIRCYHGLGDTVQFIRYAPLVRAIAAEVIVWAPPALLPLLRSMRGIDRLLALHDGSPEIGYDVDVELMELPHVFRTTLETIPASVPYLDVPPARGVRQEQASKLEVGPVWAAGEWDRRRSIPPELLAPWSNLPGVRWHLLQRGSAAAGLPPPWPAVAIDSGADDPLAAARVMRALDLVISIDSFPAHLAGALGVRTWTLLHAGADWRWMRERLDSPWYPTMRLFRQRTADDWAPVIAEVSAELRLLTGA